MPAMPTQAAPTAAATTATTAAKETATAKAKATPLARLSRVAALGTQSASCVAARPPRRLQKRRTPTVRAPTMEAPRSAAAEALPRLSPGLWPRCRQWRALRARPWPARGAPPCTPDRQPTRSPGRRVAPCSCAQQAAGACPATCRAGGPRLQYGKQATQATAATSTRPKPRAPTAMQTRRLLLPHVRRRRQRCLPSQRRAAPLPPPPLWRSARSAGHARSRSTISTATRALRGCAS
mmetsp:Transcript_25702/g.76071  ORF Transcript_25702/g.76071 Transcript_25702/m.76071 type:complete len:237 (+) Transcript_25702:272-982(+)